MEGTGLGKRLDTSAPTQARDWLDEQHRRIGSGDKGEQDLRSAQQEEEEEPIGSNKGRTQPRKSNGKGRRENGERREGATEGEDTEGLEDEPAERQGQAAPQNQGSQRLTQGPHTQSEADGALPVVDGGNGHQKSKKTGREKDFTEGPNETVQVRWSDETANTSPYMEANILGKQTREVEPPNHRNINKTQSSGKWGDSYPNNDLDRIGSSYPDAENPHANRPLDIVWETQPPPINNNKGKVYKDIMASIGLDSPNTSSESRGEGAREQGQGASYASTSIWNSASSLIALGKHIITLRQGRLWGRDTNPN